jgi:hypothetical protein
MICRVQYLRQSVQILAMVKLHPGVRGDSQRCSVKTLVPAETAAAGSASSFSLKPPFAS